MRHVRDRYRNDVTAAIARSAVRHRMDRVIVVFGVGRIDGDEWDVTPVFTAIERRRPLCFGIGHDGTAESVRNAMRMNGDQADRAR